MTERASVLPPSLAPRGLSRAQAAEYIGVGVAKFDEMVDDGRMPPPKRIDRRTVWDRLQIDEAFSAIDGIEINPWDDAWARRTAKVGGGEGSNARR